MAASGHSKSKFGAHSHETILYPRSITTTLSGLKIICGCGMVILGSLALYYKASYSQTAVGLWAGILVVISGVLGVFSVKTNASRPYVLTFFASCGISLIVSVLVLIYSSTGLARDSGYPGGFVRDAASGELVPVSQVNLPTRESAMIINLLLILLSVLDILFTLPSFIICLREACHCYPAVSYLRSGRAGSNEWLMNWLGQQPAPQQPPPQPLPKDWNQVYYSGASGLPYHQMILIPSSEPSQISIAPQASSPRRRSIKGFPVAPPPLEIYAAPQFYMVPQSFPSPGSNLSHPSIAQLLPYHPHPWLYAEKAYPGYFEDSCIPTHSQRRSQKKKPRPPQADPLCSKEKKKRKNSKDPTDSDLEKTYTGLDRELAEEFIEQTMDPNAIVNAERTLSGTESEAW